MSFLPSCWRPRATSSSLPVTRSAQLTRIEAGCLGLVPRSPRTSDAFFGKWPVDETDEQLAKAIHDPSSSWQRTKLRT